ncbi:MAG: hypothetical protein ACJ0A9_05180 [Dehalococcoidia bacterium]
MNNILNQIKKYLGRALGILLPGIGILICVYFVVIIFFGRLF